MFLGIRQKKKVPSLSYLLVRDCSLIAAKGGGGPGVQSGGVQCSKAVERPIYTSEKYGTARIKSGMARIVFYV